MARIVWDQEGQKRFETGCDRGVLYPKQSGTPASIPGMSGATTSYSSGVAWNGLTSVSKSPSGAEANDIYADNIKYASIRSAETFGATIEAYTYPDEWAECDGSAVVGSGVYIGQQVRKSFGFSFRTDIGDDTDTGIDAKNKYKIHLVYNATASPSSQQFSTINESPEAITFSWEVTTIPASAGDNYLPTATLVIDSTKVDSTKLAQFEDILYGKDAGTGQEATTPMLPMPADVIAFFQ